jgi:hypothetical protein
VFESAGPVSFKPISTIVLVNLVFIFLVELNAKKQINYLNYYKSNAALKNAFIVAYLLFAIVTFSGIDNLPFIYFQF